MPRRKEQLFLEDVFRLLLLMPIWVGPVLALCVFVLFRYVLMLLIPGPKEGSFDAGVLLRPVTAVFAWTMGGAVILAWACAEVGKFLNRHRLDRQTGLESIRDISWRDFEHLVSEAYRRKGYVADVVGSESGDGGVDIELRGHGQKVLLQCKHWRAQKVGVRVVRELLGVVVSENADKGIVVTSGSYTEEAKDFARQNPQIELVDERGLAELIQTVQVGDRSKPDDSRTPVTHPADPPSYPFCGAKMVLRTARKGQHAGSQFWGCTKYPACTGKRSA